MVRYETADTQVADARIGSRDDEVERMTGSMSWLGDVLSAAKRLQQLQQLDGMYVVCLINVHVEVGRHTRPLNICT